MFRNLINLRNLWKKHSFTSVSVRVDDSPGWTSLTSRPHDRDYSEIQEQYTDALTAWRKNPIAWRIISITTDYIVGKSFNLSSPFKPLDQFIRDFWHHPKNRMDLRLTGMSDELARAGDLFITLWRNPLDGMSYIRFLTKDSIRGIETAPNDWETETAFLENPPFPSGKGLGDRSDIYEPRRWITPAASGSMDSDVVALHYAVNRPIGALLGESDLATMIPWLQRYSRMLEDRVRLHWAARAFLYLVTVAPNKVESKTSQYAAPPESGSIIVKDETEKWETITPSLRGADASHDMKSVRNMIDAGSGYPPHWRGEGGDVNVATAEAMQGPPEKHLARRQQYFSYILHDILFTAYQRAAAIRQLPALPTDDYDKLFVTSAPDVSARDNTLLANASSTVAGALQSLETLLQANTTPDFKALAAQIILKFAGEPPDERTLKKLISQPQASKPAVPPAGASAGSQPEPQSGARAGQKSPQGAPEP